MTNKLVRLLAGTSAVLLLGAGLAIARTTTVHIMYNVKTAGGNMLQPGTYTIQVVNNTKSPELAFFQDRKQVAELPVKLVPETKKIGETEVRYDDVNSTHVLTEIDLQGWTQKLMFPGSSTQ